MSRRQPLILLLALLLSFVLVPAGLRPASAAPPSAPAAPPGGVHELTRADADTWLDGLVPAMLEHSGAPGATIAIVRGDEVVTARGFGSSNRWNPGADGAAAVDPATTQFRIGSVSKLFTAVAAMQLVEQGKLDLDGGVQQYVDVKLDVPKGEPTVRDLMTHTAGFEEYLGTGFMQTDPEELPTLREVVSNMPAQVNEPGTVSAYSNHGTALLGYIVERVSGEPYDQYVREHVMKPLGMERSSAAQPIDPALAKTVASGFDDPTSDAQAKPFELVGPAPAGSVSSTATDMARFASFLLGHGPAGVLKPETLELMKKPAIDPKKAPQYANAVNTLGLQLWLTELDGVRTIGHGGDTGLFHTMLVTFPDQDLAVFVSQNGLGVQGVGDLRESLVSQFTQRYVAAKPELPKAVSSAKADAQALAGAYTLSRSQRSGPLKIGNALGNINVIANEDGTVSFAGSPARYRETEKDVWRVVEGGPTAGTDVFTVHDGTIAYLPAHELRRTPVFELMPVFLVVIGSAVAIGLLASVIAVADAIGRFRARRDPQRPDPKQLGRAGAWGRRLMGLTGAGMAVSVIGVAVFFSLLSVMQPSAIPLRVAQVGLVLVAAGGVGAIIRAVAGIRHRTWFAAAWAVVVVLAAAAFVGTLAYYNLGTINLRF